MVISTTRFKLNTQLVCKQIVHLNFVVDVSLLKSLGLESMLDFFDCFWHAPLDSKQFEPTLLLLCPEACCVPCFRDLKLDNTLLDGNSPRRVKLCDFGFAKQWETDKNMFTHIGCADVCCSTWYGS